MKTSLRHLDEHERQQFYELIQQFTDKKGEEGYLLYAWFAAYLGAGLMQSRDKRARGALAARRKPYRARIVAAVPTILSVDALIEANEGFPLLRPETRQDLEEILSVAERKVTPQFEDYPDQFFLRVGDPISNYSRYFLLPALVTYLDSRNVPREWQWRWLTEWSERIESVASDWTDPGKGATLGLAQGRKSAKAAFIGSLKVNSWKTLRQGVKDWWTDTAVKTKNETARGLILSGIRCYEEWSRRAPTARSIKAREERQRSLHAHKAAVRGFIDEFRLKVPDA